MTEETNMPDWVLIEAAKRGKRLHLGPDMLRIDYSIDKTYRALCDMILKHEQPPVDRKMQELCFGFQWRKKEK